MNSAAFILATGLSHLDPSTLTDPRFRKASRNMILAYRAVEEALKPFLEAQCQASDLGLVLGSSHGELDMTLNYLKTLAETGTARPLLFQNSLHNSTTGFIAMNFKITGPMLTVSNLQFSGEDALEAAMDLLTARRCRYVLVVGVDTCFPDLPGLKISEMNSPGRREGAAAILLGQDCGELPALAQLCGIERQRQNSSPPRTMDHYDADGIEHLVKAVRSPGPHAKTLTLAKPDGSSSQLIWHR